MVKRYLQRAKLTEQTHLTGRAPRLYATESLAERRAGGTLATPRFGPAAESPGAAAAFCLWLESFLHLWLDSLRIRTIMYMAYFYFLL